MVVVVVVVVVAVVVVVVVVVVPQKEWWLPACRVHCNRSAYHAAVTVDTSCNNRVPRTRCRCELCASGCSWPSMSTCRHR